MQQVRPPNEAGTRCVHLVEIRIAYRISGDEYQIPSGLNCVLPLPHRLSKSALDAITQHRVANTTAYRKTEAAIVESIWQYAKNQQMIRVRATAPPNLPKSPLVAYSIAPLHSAGETGVRFSP